MSIVEIFQLIVLSLFELRLFVFFTKAVVLPGLLPYLRPTTLFLLTLALQIDVIYNVLFLIRDLLRS